jgi:hypothetical protein
LLPGNINTMEPDYYAGAYQSLRSRAQGVT